MFGGVVRGNFEQTFLETVDNRSRETLIEVIHRRIKSGTCIMSDDWKAYANLPMHLLEMLFTHKWVNHSLNFFDPVNPEIHTQTIECFWSHFKRFLRNKAFCRIGTTFMNHYGEN